MPHDPFGALRLLSLSQERSSRYYALSALDAVSDVPVSRLPVCIRIVLESLLRNCDGRRITEDNVRQLANWRPHAPRLAEIPFVVARIVLQDFTGVPLLCDLAAMRGAAQQLGHDPKIVEPLVPVDLVVDHSVQVDHFREADSQDLNIAKEFARNAERYRFIKWGTQAFDTFRVVPPGMGIVHQINLEFLARGVLEKDGVTYPDTLVGTDSHTTMINGLGVVGWGVGGIEAEAGMLGQPLVFLTPDVVGVHLHGRLPEGACATDLVLFLTERLRRARVVGKFVEFFGEGTRALTVPDRATIANMAPEYGATMGYFPVDEETVAYLAATGRTTAETEAFRAYFMAQGLFGIPLPGAIDYSEVIEFDLASVQPSIAGPKRPQDRLNLPDVGRVFSKLFSAPGDEDGYGRSASALEQRHPLDKATELGHGDVLVAAITSCTNTSNPGVMLAAGLLARKAVTRGLKVGTWVKTSLAPGSRVVTEYLAKAGLLGDLEALGFRVVAYGCTTCIGNSGPLMPELEQAIAAQDLICASVLSGNRNFEARIHPALKANFLMSPPLVVAFAIAGRVTIDMTREPLGLGGDGQPVMLKDIWPSDHEIAGALRRIADPDLYRRLYSDFACGNLLWNDIPSDLGPVHAWETSTYIAEPPFFKRFSLVPDGLDDILGARALAIFGDSVTTDHISPAGSIAPSSPAGLYLSAQGVAVADFNSYGARRGNHEVMVRGTFANLRIRNLMMPVKAGGSRTEGGLTLHQPDGPVLSIHEAATRYQDAGVPTIVFAGTEYGTGSSRDWAAKGPRLLGVRAVVAQSFERIHRSNLVGMGVLPLQFRDGESVASLGIVGDEEFHVRGLTGALKPRQDLVLEVIGRSSPSRSVTVELRVDTTIELDYLRHGGILPYVLRELLAAEGGGSVGTGRK